MITKITPEITRLSFNEFGSCVYILKTNNLITLIDTSSKNAEKELLEDLQKLKISPEKINIIILTHNHYDHIENIGLFKNAKIYQPETIKKIPEIPKIKIIDAKGHTKNDKCFLYKNILFSGDVIFDKEHNYIGRTDFPESNPKKMKESLKKLKKIKYEILCPGHLI